MSNNTGSRRYVGFNERYFGRPSAPGNKQDAHGDVPPPPPPAPTEPTVFLADPDVTLWHGDVLETLRGMPDGSVDCVITSPPYWGLRDYQTGSWEGGDPDCDHKQVEAKPAERYSPGGAYVFDPGGRLFKDVCGKCGATRQDQQLGLETTPDLFVARMVEVFREVRRVLAAHGTCWINMGDAYLPGKQLAGMPWHLAFALQDDGWLLRADIVWSKPNPMPESVTDRPTKAHEYVFLLTKQPRYFFDQEAVREPHTYDGRTKVIHDHATDNGHGNYAQMGDGRDRWPNGGRNVRSVWEIATQPYPEAHFATYPEELVRRCLLAGCPEWVCRVCGKPRERIIEQHKEPTGKSPKVAAKGREAVKDDNPNRPFPYARTGEHFRWRVETLGWSDCGHNNYRPGRVLDPFVGSGTTAHVARKHGRHAVGIDLNADYLALAAKRLQQQSLFAEGTA